MANYQQHKQKVLSLFQPVIALSKKQQQPKLQKKLEEAQKRLVEGKLFVVVCGEAKQGKSELLNAFLNEPNLFPVDVDITTNLVSTITYGDREKITVLLGEPGNTKAKKIGRDEIPNYVTEQRNTKNHQKAQMLMIEAPNSQLKDGLVFVDTPGTGSLNTEHTAITSAFIPNADVILFVSDVFAPLTTEELKFIKERISPYCQNLIFVVTKTDAVSDDDIIIESNCEKLAKLLNLSPQNILIIPVSSLNKLDYLASQNPEELIDSNFKNLENELWQLINQQRGQILLLRALGEMGKVIMELKNPIQAEWKAYQETTQEKLDVLQDQLQLTQGKLQNLLSQNSTWNTELNYGLSDIRDQVFNFLQEGFVQIRRQTEFYLDDSKLLKNPEQIASLLGSDIDGLMSKIAKILSQKTVSLYTEIEDSSGLNLNYFDIETLTGEKTEFSSDIIPFETSGMLDKTFTVARSSMFSSSAGTTLGGLIGGSIGAGIGFVFGGVGAGPGAYIGAGIGGLLGNLVGGAHGAKEGLKQLKEKNKREVYKLLKPFLEDSQLKCQNTLKAVFKDLERSMREEFNLQIKREKETCDRTLRSLQEARKRSHAEAAKRSKEVQVLLKEFGQLQSQIEQLAQEILGNDATDSGDWADA